MFVRKDCVMDTELIKNRIKIIVKEVMKKVHRKDYKGVESVVEDRKSVV